VDAERRQVTVLFTDMVRFTTFSERSGEEAAFTLMRSLSKLMDDAVHEQGGVVQGFTAVETELTSQLDKLLGGYSVFPPKDFYTYPAAARG